MKTKTKSWRDSSLRSATKEKSTLKTLKNLGTVRKGSYWPGVDLSEDEFVMNEGADQESSFDENEIEKKWKKKAREEKIWNRK